MRSMNLRVWQTVLLTAGILGVFAAVLYFMGRVPICACGVVKLWYGLVPGSESSQHFSDWYSFSHIIHGFVFYWLFWLLGKRRAPLEAGLLTGRGWTLGTRFLLALLLEVVWEIFENSPFIVNRYRAVTVSFDYYGDSIVNAVADALFMALGFFAAWRLPVWLVIALAVVMEAFVGYMIRDNLALNVIMLLYPLEAVRRWQSGG